MSIGKKIPQRQCIACREMKDKKELIRILRSSDGEFCIDATGRKNGRGAYLCKTKECLMKAVKTKALDRSFGQHISEEVYNQIVKEFDEIEG